MSISEIVAGIGRFLGLRQTPPPPPKIARNEDRDQPLSQPAPRRARPPLTLGQQVAAECSQPDLWITSETTQPAGKPPRRKPKMLDRKYRYSDQVKSATSVGDVVRVRTYSDDDARRVAVNLVVMCVLHHGAGRFQTRRKKRIVTSTRIK